MERRIKLLIGVLVSTFYMMFIKLIPLIDLVLEILLNSATSIRNLQLFIFQLDQSLP